MEWFRRRCRARDAYGRYIGEQVVIFYEDINRDRRKLFGRIVAIEANVIHLDNPRTGWRGSIDCDHCRIGQISTQEGWGRAFDDRPPDRQSESKGHDITGK